MSLISEMYDKLMMSRAGETNVIRLSTGDKIILSFLKPRFYIRYKPKNPIVEKIEFSSLCVVRPIEESSEALRVLRSFAAFGAEWRDKFQEVQKYDCDRLRYFTTKKGWYIEYNKLFYKSSLDVIVANCENWDNCLNALIDTFKELTLITTGIELDDNLEIIK